MYTQSFNVPDGAAPATPVAAVPSSAQQQGAQLLTRHTRCCPARGT